MMILLMMPVEWSAAEEPQRLTRDHADEILPVWNPGGETVMYRTNREPGRVPSLAAVESDGSRERLVATGLQEGFGLCNGSRSCWVGVSGKVVVGEQSHFHEFLEFQPGKERVKRTILDGEDENFTVKLVVDGGGGAGVFDISRDGKRALWRHSSIGGSGNVTLRVAPYHELKGQKISSLGTVVVKREQTSEPGWVMMDCSLGPKGEFVVTSERSGVGHDLFLYEVDASGKRTQLTRSGELRGRHNRQAVISPDGKVIAFTTTSAIDETRDGKIVSARSDLALLTLDDLKITPLTTTKMLGESHPSWSPDGKKLVFSRRDTREAGTVEAGEPDNTNLYLLKIN